MKLSLSFSKLEYVIYTFVLLCVVLVVVARSIPILKREAFLLVAQWNDVVIVVLSLASPLAILFSIILSSFSLEEPSLRRLITPPVRLTSDLLVSKIAFVVFWIGAVIFVFTAFLIIPNFSVLRG